jgi:hypothetical protein
MPTIRIDDEVYRYLQERAEPFTDNPNTVLRRLFGLAEPVDDRTVGRPAGMPPGWTPTRYLEGRVVVLTGPGGTHVESGARSSRGADLNQVQTDLAERVGSRNPETRHALDTLLGGAREARVGSYILTVRNK